MAALSRFPEHRRLDDCYESFHNWPLFYLLGGSDRFLADAQREFEVITAAMSRHGSGHGYPMVVKEYQPGYDWFHQGEGNYLFYMLCAAGPGNAVNLERARRFPGLFLGEDPEAPNYDRGKRIILCARNGSMGPAFRTFEDGPYWPWHGYNLPFYDVPGCTSHEAVGADPALPERLGRAMRERQGRGDSVVNLLATGLAANAFLLTGEEKYRRWVLEYTGAWIERAGANDGIVPDNVGLSGEVGEHIDGKWYGASYGWAWPHGWHSVGQAVGVAAQNAALLTGDLGYMDFPRSQIDHLIARGIERDDQLYVPHKYDDPGKVSYEPGGWMQYPIRNEDGTALQRDGWFEFMPMYPSDIAHLWCMSMSPGDSRRFERDPQEERRPVRRKLLAPHQGPGGARLGLAGLAARGFRPVSRADSRAQPLPGAGAPRFHGAGRGGSGRVLGRLFPAPQPGHLRGPGAAHPRRAAAPLQRGPAGVAAAPLRRAAPAPGPAARRGRARVRNDRGEDRPDPGEPRAGAPAGADPGRGDGRARVHRSRGRRGPARRIPVNASTLEIGLPSGTRIGLELGMRRFVNLPTLAFPW